MLLPFAFVSWTPAAALGAIGAEVQFLHELAHAGKIAQGRFIAQKR